ncbi:MAG TPA: peptidylprolyl isomerase [archaeon]|nr:peptidylprolyl isomerase [archaeon]
MEKNDLVRINYIGRLENGEIFDLTNEEIAKTEKIFNQHVKYKPVPIIIGANFLIPGLDKALLDMKIGEKKTIEVKQEDGFGPRQANLVQVVPVKNFKDVPTAGMVVDFQGMKGRIQSVNAGRVRIDFNHPLAGHTLKYDIEITEKIEGVENQAKAILEFFGVDNGKIKIIEKSIEIDSPVQQQIRQKIASLIKEHIKTGNDKIEKVRFVEEY